MREFEAKPEQPKAMGEAVREVIAGKQPVEAQWVEVNEDGDEDGDVYFSELNPEYRVRLLQDVKEQIARKEFQPWHVLAAAVIHSTTAIVVSVRYLQHLSTFTPWEKFVSYLLFVSSFGALLALFFSQWFGIRARWERQMAAAEIDRWLEVKAANASQKGDYSFSRF